MDTKGYTLVEALTALVMVGLAMTGAGEAVHFLSGSFLRLQNQSTTASEVTFVQHALAGLPADLGPFQSGAGGFSGSSRTVSFPCDVSDRCTILIKPADGATDLITTQAGRLRSKTLRHLPDLRFTFVSAKDGSRWPSWPDGRSGDRLSGIVLSSGGAPIAYLRLPKAQPDACAFDLATGDCRKLGG